MTGCITVDKAYECYKTEVKANESETTDQTSPRDPEERCSAVYFPSYRCLLWHGTGF